MTDSAAPNRLLSVSLERPFLVMLALFFIASLIKVLDTFILPVNELVGELIITKALGLALVAIYVWACGRKLRDIGFHRQALGQSLLITAVCVGGLIAASYGVQLVALRASGEEASLALSALDPKTGMAGGLLFGLWLFLANFVNSAMEEGLFRGAMLRHFRIRHSVWKAIMLQASLFALWHLNWPVQHFLTGEADLGQAAFEAFGLLLGTGIGGVVYGYLYHKTNNLWAPFLAHIINNTASNVLFIRTSEGLQPGLEFGLFIGMFLCGHLVLIPVIGWWANRPKLPEVQPWGSFEVTRAG
jgi:membrane protease YdiL (CAAX protease family)